MLVLAGEMNDRFFITVPPEWSGVIEVVLVDLKIDGQTHRGRARIGFGAPKEVGVDREEVWLAKGGDRGTAK